MELLTQVLPEQPDIDRFGANWQVQFNDAEGRPLNMGSFDEIGFGDISYKEIFQNVKTLLATPLFSCPLERTLGIDQSIVDQPYNQAAAATMAMMDAIYHWEPRAEVMQIDFTPDGLSGHLTAKLRLKIKNLIYGTNTPYSVTNAFASPPKTAGGLPQVNVPVPGPTGPPGPQGPAAEWGNITGTLADQTDLKNALDLKADKTTPAKYRIKADGTFQLYNATTGKYHTVVPSGAAGAVGLDIEQSGET